MRRSEAREKALRSVTTKHSVPKGKVWLVGAGSSDPGLFTLKGRAVLSQAQVVVYDALVGAGILSMIPEAAEKIYVGKRAGNHAMTQDEINELLVKKAGEGKRVVRLKGGDPFLFGRGGEELLVLGAYGIDYEVVPGISSALAVPAYNGIPVTDRNCASSVHIITGHKRADKPLKLPFEAYVKVEGTLVFLMGLSALPDIVSGLLHAGMDPAVPAAVLERGTTAGQRRVCAPLSELESETEKAHMHTPAIIVVGAVAAMSEQLAWYEKLPLFGRRFVLTRPRERMDALADQLREQGAEVLELPVIGTKPLPLTEKIQKGLDEFFLAGDASCLVFTSPAGVHTFFQLLCDSGRDARVLGGVTLAVIGGGTKSALREYGMVADLMPEDYDGVSLGTLLGERLPDGSRVLIPRSAIGNPALITCMEKRAAELGKTVTVTDLPIYETIEKHNELIPVAHLVEEDAIDGVFFTSASTVRAFLHANPSVHPAKICALCIGEMTAQAAREAGMQVHVAQEASVEGLAGLAEKLYANE
ncbi:MAG: uroporphyrinogen-III C-methyltransferase [Lachnospiraceae bacterium]|nr:uroporphyrinogen-III C-methyltransferase [bacterium]MDY5517541.1 uroporphyrinogen-III C-methyltransferase [Lachnospiraceae bacterium]